jgi:hypothetical protein
MPEAWAGWLTGSGAATRGDVWIVGQHGWVRWTGHGWQVGRWPSVGRGGPALTGQLLTFGPRDVWLLGSYTAGSQAIAFARRYNGSRWQVMPTPGFTNFQVSGSSPDAICAITGQFGSSSNTVTRLACWNGRRWLRVALPVSLNARHAIIGGLLVRSLTDIWVGGANISVATASPGWPRTGTAAAGGCRRCPP